MEGESLKKIFEETVKSVANLVQHSSRQREERCMIGIYQLYQVKERKGGVVGIYQLTNLCVILVCVTHVYRTKSF